MTRADRLALALYVSVAVAIGFVDFRVRRFPDHVVTKYIPGVLQGTYGAPAIYRPLSPFVIDRVTRATGWDPLVVFLATRLLVIYAALAAFHWYMRAWFTAEVSLGATLGLAALLPLTFTNSWAHPDSMPELALVSVGCRLVAAGRDAWLVPLLVVGMLNRETTAFVAVLWAVHRLRADRSWRTVGVGAGLLATCVAMYAGIRWARGFETYAVWMLRENLSLLKPLPAGFDPYTRMVGYVWLVLLAVPAALAAVAARRRGAPPFFASGAITSALVLGVAVAIAAIAESRVLLPILPMLAPAVVAAILPHAAASAR